MPSPAQNSVSVAVHSALMRYRGSWYPPGQYNTVPLSWVQRSQAVQCPPTTSNPQVHGIRAMAPWNKRWFRSHCIPSSWSISQQIPGGSMDYEYSGVTPLSLAPSTTHPGEFWDLVTRWWPSSPVMEFSADQEARTSTLNKLSQKKWDLGVTALELRQTAGLVTDLAKGMTKTVENLVNSRHNARQQVDSFFRKVREHGSFDKAAEQVGMTDVKLLDTLKDRWMQYQFGVRPLLNDVDNATTYLADKLAQGTPMIVRAKAGAERVDTYMGSRNCSGDGMGLLNIRPRIEETCQVHYSVVYEMPTGQVSDLTSLGLDNPWNVGWEVARLSWMVDYVVGVGDWLQSFTAANGLVFREGCRSRLRKLAVTEWITEQGPVSGKVVLERAPDLSRVYFDYGDFKRELLETRLYPAVVPSIKSTLGLTQLANSLFAMSNVLGGKPGLR